MAISDLMIVVSDSKNVAAPAGWTLMNQDLNEGSGGKYIYLAYRDTASGPFITDITFIIGENSGIAAPSGYTRLPEDLNQGASGKFIYLCFLRGDGPPITNLGLGSYSEPLPYGDGPYYMMVPQDLNEGAKGRYIYLYVGRYRSRWMEELAPFIRDRPLNRIALPGTHDSGTYSLTRDGGISRDAPSAIWNAVGTPGLESMVYDWALTQNLSIAAQLEAGIRYLDIRVLDNRQVQNGRQDHVIADEDRERQIFVVHSKFGTHVDAVLQQIETFLRANSKEIVILRLGTNCSDALTDRGKRHLINQLVRRRMEDLMVPRSMGAQVTPAALWAAGKRLVVLVNGAIWADLNPGPELDLVWNEDDDTARGAAAMVLGTPLSAKGTGKLAVLKDALDTQIAGTAEQPSRLQVLGCCLTPDDATIVTGTVSSWFEPLTSATLSYWNKLTGQNSSLPQRSTLHQACAMPATPAAERWARTDWQNESINILSTDFFQLAQTVDICLLRNMRRRRFYLVSASRLVVDLPGGATAAGTRPIVWSRNTPQSKNQQWILEPSGHIRSVLDPTMVLDVEGERATPGTTVILWPEKKPAAANQLWDIDADGHIRSRLNRSLVLDIKDGNVQPGTSLIVWTEAKPAAQNQLFFAREI